MRTPERRSIDGVLDAHAPKHLPIDAKVTLNRSSGVRYDFRVHP
jgi:hypothetical protein